jgi:flagellar protein FliO/FliZ
MIAMMQAAEVAADPAGLAGLGLRSLAALAIVGVLLAATVWALTRVSAVRRGRQLLSVESALSLGEKRSLVVVTVEGRRLLLGVSPGSVSLVTELHTAFDGALETSLQATAPKS